MTQQRLACVLGARPNFMKMAPILRALDQHPNVQVTLVHTGQHYDPNLSDVFFADLNMRRPDVCLEVGSGSHAVQTARIMERFEPVVTQGTPTGPFTRVVVVGDVNSTMACALVAVKLGVPAAHVEAGLRSFDRTMPEEINRIVTDSICDCLLVSEPDGRENLRNEGRPESMIHVVGNVMIDTLKSMLPKAKEQGQLSKLGLTPGEFGFVTLHRPANVDEPATLRLLLEALAEVSADLPMVFAVHPRTQQKIAAFGLRPLVESARRLHVLPPLGYLDCLNLTSQAKVIVTDSGGLQEESTALGVPCLTMRANTERPITVTEGTSTLIGSDISKLRRLLGDVLAGRYKKGMCPKLWDGHAADRIAAILANPGRPQ